MVALEVLVDSHRIQTLLELAQNQLVERRAATVRLRTFSLCRFRIRTGERLGILCEQVLYGSIAFDVLLSDNNCVQRANGADVLTSKSGSAASLQLLIR